MFSGRFLKKNRRGGWISGSHGGDDQVMMADARRCGVQMGTPRPHGTREGPTLMTTVKVAGALVGVALSLAIRITAQAPPQIGQIGPLPAPAPAASFDVFEKSIVDLLAAQRIGTVTSHD